MKRTRMTMFEIEHRIAVLDRLLQKPDEYKAVLEFQRKAACELRDKMKKEGKRK